MTDLRSGILIITGAINDVNTLIKRQIVVDSQKQCLILCCLLETQFKYNDTDSLKAKGWKNMSCANTYQTTRIGILISDKVKFRTRSITSDKKGHFHIDEAVISSGCYHIPNVDAHKNRALKYITQKLLEPKGETDKSMIIVGDFNTYISGTE